ncbi:hypothetical protein J1N35_022470 [Gossypium stocksii]|uniref:SNRNP25 ubiquitin-like domain-containing protein n=1 Tax=Gossypium stocksii TaxID=47602 RepID=A0A9D3VHS6_9ROSI|nr:hypothetical protein J1N35_022470 [Gossypium stocksii]
MESGVKEEEKVMGYNSKNVKKVALHSTLIALLDDPILADVLEKPSLSDVDTLINLELGSAMCISIIKLDGTSFSTLQMLSLSQLGRPLATDEFSHGERFEARNQEESDRVRAIQDGRHVWANFCLAHHNEKLLDDGTALQDFGVQNNSQVHFLPYVVSKGSRRHSKRRKHRFFHGPNKHS